MNMTTLRASIGALLALGLSGALLMPGTAQADDEYRWRHRDWHHGEWQDRHSHVHVAPGYAYAPPPVVYAPPPSYPGFGIQFNFD